MSDPDNRLYSQCITCSSLVFMVFVVICGSILVAWEGYREHAVCGDKPQAGLYLWGLSVCIAYAVTAACMIMVECCKGDDSYAADFVAEKISYAFVAFNGIACAVGVLLTVYVMNNCMHSLALTIVPGTLAAMLVSISVTVCMWLPDEDPNSELMAAGIPGANILVSETGQVVQMP